MKYVNKDLIEKMYSNITNSWKNFVAKIYEDIIKNTRDYKFLNYPELEISILPNRKNWCGGAYSEKENKIYVTLFDILYLPSITFSSIYFYKFNTFKTPEDLIALLIPFGLTILYKMISIPSVLSHELSHAQRREKISEKYDTLSGLFKDIIKSYLYSSSEENKKFISKIKEEEEKAAKEAKIILKDVSENTRSKFLKFLYNISSKIGVGCINI